MKKQGFILFSWFQINMPNKVEKEEVEEVEAGDVEAVEDKNKDRKHDWGAADLEKVWRRE